MSLNEDWLKTIEQRRDICRQGEPTAQCDFLIPTDGRYECVKGDPEGVALVEDRRARRPHTAHKDNCSGPPNFTPSN
jgi:hypothetical protein